MSKSRIKRLSRQIKNIDDAIRFIDERDTRIEHLTAENERLRDALALIRDDSMVLFDPDYDLYCDEDGIIRPAVEVAREALAAQENNE